MLALKLRASKADQLHLRGWDRIKIKDGAIVSNKEASERWPVCAFRALCVNFVVFP